LVKKYAAIIASPTLRIKGILDAASEVTLELLSLQDSVELIADVAALDDVPPAVMVIAQLCGRLPLCLNVSIALRSGNLLCSTN
jgi:hypothetical protein